MRPDDLRGAARNVYDMWRNTFGLSEQSAMRALEQDGAIPLSEDEKLARRFQNIFGLSESEARRAVDDHGGRSVPPVSESAGRSSAAPQPGDALWLRAAGGWACGDVRPVAARAALLTRWAGRSTDSARDVGVKVPDLDENRRSSVRVQSRRGWIFFLTPYEAACAANGPPRFGLGSGRDRGARL
jgi:hypothetical protein